MNEDYSVRLRPVTVILSKPSAACLKASGCSGLSKNLTMDKHRPDVATRQHSHPENLLEYLNSTNKNRITPFIPHYCKCSPSIYLSL